MDTNTITAKGSFSVKTSPAGDGKFLVQKVFSGDIEGTSEFHMYTAGSPDGAAAYVALEVVKGTLKGKPGSFVLMHNGTMTKTSQQLTITIAPGLATEELKGLEGKFTINIVNKEHFYVMEYSMTSPA